MENAIIRIIIGLCAIIWGMTRETLLKNEEPRMEIDIFFCVIGLILISVGTFELILAY